MEVIEAIKEYIYRDRYCKYKIIIGTDSHEKDKVLYITALIVHRIGKGAIYFYSKYHGRPIKDFRHRIYTETVLSLNLAVELKGYLKGIAYADLEIHADVGENGKSRDLIKEIVGWIIGSGYKVKIKPHSHGASKVADRYTR
jgi:predicted RNase H-related nuclease YkuK (DUF458 family)